MLHSHQHAVAGSCNEPWWSLDCGSEGKRSGAPGVMRLWRRARVVHYAGTHVCACCGFDRMDEPPERPDASPSVVICPSCGWHYRASEVGREFSYDYRRERWMDEGCPWWAAEGRGESPPADWSPKAQLERIGVKMREPRTYDCPVCGFDGLAEPAYFDAESPSDDICECCGFQFGLHDFSVDGVDRSVFHEQWRERWIAGGCLWWSTTPPPPDWSAQRQLERIGIRRSIDRPRQTETGTCEPPPSPQSRGGRGAWSLRGWWERRHGG